MYRECNRSGVQYAEPVQRFFSTDDLPVSHSCTAGLHYSNCHWKTLFNLLNDVAVFIRESYQRVKYSMRETNTRQKPQTPLSSWRDTVVGQTLCSQKKCLDILVNPERRTHVCMSVFSYRPCVATSLAITRAKAQGFKEGLLRYESVKRTDIPDIESWLQHKRASKAVPGISFVKAVANMKTLNKGRKEQTLKWRLHCLRKEQRRKKTGLERWLKMRH